MENDRRIRRTKKILTDAFIELLIEKKLNEISIKELCEKADVNRGTFYLHYQDIYDFKHQLEQELYEELKKLIHPFTSMTGIDPYSLFFDLYTYIQKNAKLFIALLGPNGDISFLTTLKTLFKDYYLLSTLLQNQPITHTMNLEYAYEFVSSGFIGLVTNWLQSEHPYTIEEMATLTSRVVFDGLPALIKE